MAQHDSLEIDIRLQKAAKRERPLDLVMVALTLALSVVGFYVYYRVTSISSPSSIESLTRHKALGMSLGIVTLFVASQVDFRVYRKLATVLLGVSILLMGLTSFSSMGVFINGAQRWLDLPGGLRIQPIEILKFVVVIFFAYSLDKKWVQAKSDGRSTIHFVYSVAFHGCLLGLIGLLAYSQSDAGSLAILGALCFIILFTGGVRKTDILILFVVGIILFTLFILTSPHRIERIVTAFESTPDSSGAGYQADASEIAFQEGGLWGVGVTEGKSVLGNLPEQATDFAITLVAEEFGFAGIMAVLFAFIIIIGKGIRLAFTCEDSFGRLLAIGLSSLLAIQVFLNLAVASTLLPVTGVPLPLISNGNTNFVITMASIGVLLNIARVRLAPATVRDYIRRSKLRVTPGVAGAGAHALDSEGAQ